MIHFSLVSSVRSGLVFPILDGKAHSVACCLLHYFLHGWKKGICPLAGGHFWVSIFWWLQVTFVQTVENFCKQNVVWEHLWFTGNRAWMPLKNASSHLRLMSGTDGGGCTLQLRSCGIPGFPGSEFCPIIIWFYLKQKNCKLLPSRGHLETCEPEALLSPT